VEERNAAGDHEKNTVQQVMTTCDEAMSCAAFTGGQADRWIGSSLDSQNTERPPNL